MPPPRFRQWSRVSLAVLGHLGLRNHLDGMHRALLEARPAAGALVVVELVTMPDAQLDHRVLRAGPEAAIALAAVAARQAAACLVGRLLLGQAADHLTEARDALRWRRLGLLAAGGVAEVPQVEHVEGHRPVLVSTGRRHAAQPRVDVPGGLLAVP